MTICVVTGGHRYPWTSYDEGVVHVLFDYLDVDELWHGGAVGVDTGVAEFAKKRGISTRVFLPEPWLFDEDYPRALMQRNAEMMKALDAAVHHDGQMGFVLAFPGEEGTDNAVNHALRHRLHVVDLRGHVVDEIWRKVHERQERTKAAKK